MKISKEQILEKLESFKKIPELSEYRFGLAGSYVRGDDTEESDIDIVVDTGILSVNSIFLIKDIIWNDDHVDVLLLDALRKEDEDLDELCKDMGLEIDEESPYKNIVREVLWIE